MKKQEKQEMINKAMEICRNLNETWSRYSEWFGEGSELEQDAWNSLSFTCDAYAQLFDLPKSKFMFPDIY